MADSEELKRFKHEERLSCVLDEMMGLGDFADSSRGSASSSSSGGQGEGAKGDDETFFAHEEQQPVEEEDGDGSRQGEKMDEGGGGGGGGAAFDDAVDGLEGDEDWHVSLPMGQWEPDREGSSGSAETSHSSQDRSPDNSQAGGVQTQTEETEDSQPGERSEAAPLEDSNIKDEPIDEGNDAALLLQIKEELEHQEEELKISSVYSVGGGNNLASPTMPTAVPAPTPVALFIPGGGAVPQATAPLPVRPPAPVATSLSSLARVPRPPQRPVPGSVRRSSKMENIARRRRPYPERVYLQRITYLGMTEQECRNKLHLSPKVVDVVTRIVASDASAGGPCALPVAVKVTAALTFFANGSFQHNVASVAGITQKAASAAIQAVSSSLVRHANEHIIFPTTPESQLETKQGFLSKSGFPGVLGAIDCTHVRLRAPHTQAVTYVNQKGEHSINIQVICDSDCLVTHVYANFPGSAQDSFILAKSAIPTVFQGDPPLDGWLLGDDSYPMKTWLITPYITPTTRRQRGFNRVFSSARSVIERTLGLIKTRFKCLDRSSGSLPYSPQSVSAFFVACCVLHNIATRHGCHFDLTEETLQDFRQSEAELHVPYQQEEQQSARERRDHLAAQLCP